MFLTRTANLLYDSLLSLLYPQACAVCGALVAERANGVACAACWAKVKLFDPADVICG
jgi:hypothetical protein